MPLFRRKTADKPKAQGQQSSGLPLGLTRTPSDRSTGSIPKSPGTPDSWIAENDVGLPVSALNGSIPIHKRPRSLLLSDSTFLPDDQDLSSTSLESPMRTSSRLSKTLLEVMRDKDALSCFIAFLKSQHSEHLAQFWCDAESFQAATIMRMRTHTLQSVSKSGLHQRRTDSVHKLESSEGQQENAVPQAIPTVNTHNSSLDHSGLGRVWDGEQGTIGSIEISVKDVTQSDQISSPTFSNLPGPPGHNKKSDNVSLQTDLPHLDTTPLQQTVPGGITIKHDVGQISPDNVPSPQRPNTSGMPPSNMNDPTSCDILHLQSPCEGSCVNTPEQPPASLAATLSLSEGTVSSQGRPSANVDKESIAEKLRKSIERDAVTIFSTYIAKDAPKPIQVDNGLRSEVISKICQEDGKVDPECFASCQRFVLTRLEAEFFPAFKDSSLHCKHQVTILTRDKIFLPDILLNENALCYFTEYMEQEGGSDLIQLWLAADNFQQQLSASPPGHDWEQAQNDAMVIYDRYFSLQATHPMGFDDKLRFEVESNICREGGPLPDCFTKPKNIVLQTLNKVYFPAYLQSQVYYRYLSDLVNTVQMAEDQLLSRPAHKGHRRTESDASSEHSVNSVSTGVESIKSRNTLLAVDTRRGKKKAGHIDGDFSLDLDMLNPDELWKRPNASSLTLGSVNNLGQFVSHLEQDAELDRKKGFGLFKIRKAKDKEQEEVALRIAQMIINDVNTMTKTGERMTSSDPPS